MAAAITLKLDFRTISLHDGAEIRPYFVIGAANVQQAQIQELAKKIRNSGLEVLSINADYRKDLGLDANFQGIAVFIQKHLANDKDHSNNGHGAGFDIYESFQKILQIQPLPVEAHASIALQQLIGQVHRFQASIPEYLDYNPQLAGADKTLQLLKNHQAPVSSRAQPSAAAAAQKPQAAIAQTFRHDHLMVPGERAAAIKETQEHILTLTFLADELKDGDPQKVAAKLNVIQAQLKLAKLKSGN